MGKLKSLAQMTNIKQLFGRLNTGWSLKIKFCNCWNILMTKQ